jgi:LPPG:FO 2-phospho-L-lactate transferase
MRELGVPQTQASIARHYAGLIDGLVIDESDSGEAASLPIPSLATQTLMLSLDDREGLAHRVLAFGRRLGRRR